MAEVTPIQFETLLVVISMPESTTTTFCKSKYSYICWKKNYSTINNFKRSLRSIIGNWTFALNIFLTIKHPTATRIITMLKFIAIIHDKSIWPMKKLQFVAIFSCSIVKVRIFKQKSPWKSLSICNYFCKWTNQHSLILVKPTKYERRLKYCCIVIKLMYSNK